MNRFTRPEHFDHSQPPRTAVLAVQLGTPAQPEAGAVRRYLAEFLADPRVVEIPRLLWLPILHGIILRVRPARSARKYSLIWSAEGSPLAVHTAAQAKLLRGELGQRGQDVEVAYAMRYGEPSIPAVMRELRERNVTRLLVLPLYPQYSGATGGTAFDAVFAELAQWRNVPELRTVRSFPADPGWIEAMARSIEQSWLQDGPPERLVMSFHGMPRRTLHLGDPYYCECQLSARLLAQRLGLREEDYVLSFQSRFGRAAWLEPYTAPTLAALGKQGVRRVDVVCPGFVSDCLETLEEIAIEGKQSFIEAGGKDFRYLPCLNQSTALIDALAGLVEQNLEGWPTRWRDDEEAAGDRLELEARRKRAKALGAPD